MEKKKIDFETAESRLEQIVEKLESGEETLDSSLSLFEEGVSLIKICNEILDEADRKIKIIEKEDNND